MGKVWPLIVVLKLQSSQSVAFPQPEKKKSIFALKNILRHWPYLGKPAKCKTVAQGNQITLSFAKHRHSRRPFSELIFTCYLIGETLSKQSRIYFFFRTDTATTRKFVYWDLISKYFICSVLSLALFFPRVLEVSETRAQSLLNWPFTDRSTNLVFCALLLSFCHNIYLGVNTKLQNGKPLIGCTKKIHLQAIILYERTSRI